MAKTYFNRKNANGEEEIIERDDKTNTETVWRTTETRESKIKKSLVFTDEQKNLLLELFK